MQNQSVYAGPDVSNYATVGSIGNNEQVYILGMSAGWYHIQYIVTGTNNGSGVPYEKSGFVPIGRIYNITGGIPHEEQMTGGYAYASVALTVRTCDDFDISQSVGSVFVGEGMTVLYDYFYSDWTGKSYQVAYIEYSTSSGTKRGYVYDNQLVKPVANTSIARVITTSSAYAGADDSYVKLGGAYYNEYVSILSSNGTWAFTEYNTASGRKRGYMLLSNLSICNLKVYSSILNNQRIKKGDSTINSIWRT